MLPLLLRENSTGSHIPSPYLPPQSQDPPDSTAQDFPWLQAALPAQPPLSSQVQGAEEANKERQRQKELESNYRRVWGSPEGEDTGDLDEFDF